MFGKLFAPLGAAVPLLLPAAQSFPVEKITPSVSVARGPVNGVLIERNREVAKEAREVHLMFNNCYANYGTTNAREIADLLNDLG